MVESFLIIPYPHQVYLVGMVMKGMAVKLLVA